MPKGKKFDAAQKHFLEKEIKWKRHIRELEDSTKTANEKAETLAKENEALRNENQQLKEINQQLMLLHDLTDEDIKALLAKARNIEKFSRLMDTAGMISHF